jgi:H+/Cl- antiporter ClcA
MKRNPLVFTRWVLLWVALGIVCGLFASIYWIILAKLIQVLDSINGLSLLFVMPLAGLLIGLVIMWLGNPGEIGLIIDNIHMKQGKLAARENPSMILSSLISIASGGSAGPEAPMVQVTGSVGTWFADRFQLKGEALRSLSIAGMASGFTVLFGAPLGGTFFALEILHHHHVVEYYEAILPAIVASCASYVIFAGITQLGIGPIWHFPQYNIDSVDDFAQAMLYGVVGAAVGWFFIIVFRKCEQLFERLHGPIYLRAILAGLGLAILAVWFPLTRYFGEHQLEEIVEGNFTVTFLLGLAVAKILAICITVTGGWRGGIIIPLFFTGACLGKAIAVIHPELNAALVMICLMASLNVTVTRTPISTTLLLSKLTGFSTLIPILFASMIGFFLAPRIPFIASQLKTSSSVKEEPIQ